MRKTIISTLTLMFICFAFISSAFSMSGSIIFNSDFTIQKKHIHFSQDLFELDDKGKGIITITNNTPHKKIIGGYILFNKKRIKLKKGFKKKDRIIEKKIKFRKTNRLIVFLKGKKGASINVTIKKKGLTSTPPEVSFMADPSVISIGETSILSWNSKNADDISIDNGIGGVAKSGSLSVNPQVISTYTLTAQGPGGTTTAQATVSVTHPAPTVNLVPPSINITQGGSVSLSWTSTNATSAFMDNGIDSVPVNGSVTVYPSNTTTYTLTVTGSIGSASANSVVRVTGNPTPQPDGSYGKQYEDQIPLDATVQSYDEKRFALITGEVQAQNATPIAGASITIHGHPEYGTAFTDAAGRFSIPVEGGGNLTVVYQKAGRLTTHRKVYVPWNDTAIAKTIQMILHDPVATTVTFDGNPDAVVTHQSTEVSDEFGSRSFSMVFTGDNRAFLVGDDGNDVQELTTITIRATEFETPESMPAILPPNSAYTYCVDLAVDGIKRVRFEKPVMGLRFALKLLTINTAINEIL